MFRLITILLTPIILSVSINGCLSGTSNIEATASEADHEIETDRQDSSLIPFFSEIDSWHAGLRVDSIVVYAYGIENCFKADTISDSIFSVMNGITFHPGDTPVARDELRYLRMLHYNSEGEIILGEMVCNQKIADDLLDIFRNLFAERYPIERMLLASRFGGDDEASMTANNTSCFNSRNIAGSNKPSYHAYGMAVDINPLYNPYIKEKDGKIVRILPQQARYTDPKSPYRIGKGDLCHRLFIKHGFKWGGSWRSVKDFQHFEKH